MVLSQLTALSSHVLKLVCMSRMWMDLLRQVWGKQITMGQLDHLEQAIPEVLTDLECLFPAWELDMTRCPLLYCRALPPVLCSSTSACQ